MKAVMKLFYVFAVACLNECFAETIPQWSCDFDDGLCSFQDPEGDQNWLLVDASRTRDSYALDGPLKGTSNSGKFLQLANSTGQLVSSSVDLHGDYCFSLDYYVTGLVSYSYINIKAGQPEGRYGQINVFHKEPSDNNLDGWQHFQNTIAFDAPSNVILIEAKSANPKSLAIDNLRLSKGACLKRGVLECDLNGMVAGVARFLPLNSLPPSCHWLQGTFRNHARWLMAEYLWKTKFISPKYSLHLIPQFPEVVFKTLGPEDGAHCLHFSFKSSGQPWSIIETAVNTGIVNTLFSAGVERNFLSAHYKMIQEIDPVVPIRVKIDIGSNSKFYIESLRLVKGRCSKPATCDFSTSTCGYVLQGTDIVPMLVGQGRLMRPEPNYFPIYNNGRNFMYIDFSLPQSKEVVMINSENVVAYGPHCVRFVFARDTVPKIISQIRMEKFYIPLHLRYSNETLPWTTAIADFKANGMFTVEFQMGNADGTKIVMFREISLFPGTCENNPKKVFTDVDFHCYQTGHYIPRYRSCDGVIDCPMGEDEGEHCVEPSQQCSNGGIPCKRRGHQFCLNDKTQFCNDVQDCDDAIDEDPRMCNEDAFCDSYCLNESKCSFENFRCECSGRFSGKRCSI